MLVSSGEGSPKFLGMVPLQGIKTLAILLNWFIFRCFSSAVITQTEVDEGILQPLDLQEQVLHAYTGSVSAIWSVLTV